MPNCPLTLRTLKGSKLTFAELDGNFLSLKGCVDTLENNIYNNFLPLSGGTLTGALSACTGGIYTDELYSCSNMLTVWSDITIEGNVVINGSATTINTEVIKSKDNNIVLNYSGTTATANGGGISVLEAQGAGIPSSLYVDENGCWHADPGFCDLTVDGVAFTAQTPYIFVDDGSINSITTRYTGNNITDSDYSNIGGGKGNVIDPSSDYSNIAGGLNNLLDDNTKQSFIGGGFANEIIGGEGDFKLNVVVGGEYNVIDISVYSSIVGGKSNNVYSSNLSFIGGGRNNEINDSEYSTIGGGRGNDIKSRWSFIGAGYGNYVTGGSREPYGSSIVGGRYNRIFEQSNYSVIVGGQNNLITGATRSMIGGGFGNTIFDYQRASNINNGVSNTITKGYSGNAPLFPLPQIPNLSLPFALGNVIGGGANNTIEGTARSFPNGNNYSTGSDDAQFNTIGGGYRNYVFGRYNTIAGGGRIQTQFSYIYEGGNIISGNSSTIGGGGANLIKGRYSTIAGGGGFKDFKNATIGNTIVGNASFIGGGFNNDIDTSPWYNSGVNPGNSISAIIGGSGNKIHNGRFSWSTLGGGAYNEIRVGGAFVGGGGSNLIGYGTTPAGFTNDGYRGFIGGGYANHVYSDYSSIVGGEDNEIFQQSEWAFIGGGQLNYMLYSNKSFIGGGSRNEMIGDFSTIVGGERNEVKNYSQGVFIGGGFTNIVDVYAGTSVIVGGANNNVTNYNYYSFIGAGRNNTVDNSYYSSIVGGQNNTIIGSGNNSEYNAILGGRNNTISTGNTNSVIGGGLNNNIIDARYGNILGGSNNTIIDARYGNILGGDGNYIKGYGFSSSNIVGGSFNTINARWYNFIGGGESNTIIGTGTTASSIIGGQSNTVSHSNSHIIGSNITSVSANTTHVERFNIKTVNTGSTSTEVLVRETNGMVNTTPFSTVSGGLNGKYVELITGYTANVTQTITHNLGTGDEVVVDVIDTTNNERIGSVIDNYQTNALDLTLSQNYASIKIVIIG